MILLSAPIRVCIDITNKCNLNCVHCHALANEYRHGDALSTEEILSLIGQCQQIGVFVLQLSGGEPTMHPDFELILEYALKRIPAVVLSTNGSTATPDFADRLASMNLKSIQVSLDGATATVHDQFRGKKGSWESATKAIKLFTKAGIRTRVACTLHKKNANQLKEMVDCSEKFGAVTFRLMSFMAGGRALRNQDWMLTPSESREIARNLKKTTDAINKNIKVSHDIPFIEPSKAVEKESFGEIDQYFVGCEAGKQQIRIAFNGDVWPCALIHSSDFWVGNIRQKSISEIWKDSPVLDKFRQISYLNRKGCQNCDYGYLCNGGCPAMSINMQGSFDSPDPRCPYNSLLS
jgi:radical SAM protein with 4Fe4S-binding SPASM domain